MHRSFLFSLLVASAFTAPASYAALTSEQAASADAFVDSIGVNIHLSYTSGPYYQHFFDIIEPRLKALGVRRLRDGMNPGWTGTSILSHLQQLAADGFRFDLITNPSTLNGTQVHDIIVKQIGVSHVASVENINEPNISWQGNWVTPTRANQQDIWNAIKSDPDTQSIAVYGPSLVIYNTAPPQLGDLSTWLDAGNIHPYYSGRNPETSGWGPGGSGSLAWNVTYMAAPVSGSKPVVATESGLQNGTSSSNYTPEDISAFYIPRMYLYYFASHIAVTYNYEMIDEGSNMANAQNNYGLLYNDGSLKASYVALQNLIALLQDPGAAFTPQSLSYALTGSTSGVSHLLMQKRDGTFYLAIWLGLQDWDTTRNVPQLHANQMVTLHLGQNFSSISSVTSNTSTTWTPLAVANQSVTFPVQDQVTIIRLSPI